MLAARCGAPVTMLGGGSNVLVSDAGVRGLVVRPRGGAITKAGGSLVRADAGVTINGLVRWTVLHACAGLEAWAGTPGTVGGAIFGNAHFSGRSLGELVESVSLAAKDGAVSMFRRPRLRLATTGAACSKQARCSCLQRFACRQATRRCFEQPHASRSPSASARSRSRRRALAASFRTRSAAWTSCPTEFHGRPVRWSTAPGSKGFSIGGARVSPTHANFIVNDGGATAARDQTSRRALPRRSPAAVRRRTAG